LTTKLPVPSFFRALFIARSNKQSQNAEANNGDQGLPPDGEESRRQVGEDKEEQGQRQVQSPLQPLPLHPRHPRQGEGRQAEAVSAAWASGERPQVNVPTPNTSNLSSFSAKNEKTARLTVLFCA